MPEEEITDSARLPPLLAPDPTRLFTNSSMSLRSRIVGGGGYIVRIKTRQETTDDILSVRDTFLVLSSRDFLRAASFALFASISARRRSARDGAEDILPKVTRYAGT